MLLFRTVSESSRKSRNRKYIWQNYEPELHNHDTKNSNKNMQSHIHKFACTDVTNNNEKKNMHAAQTLTHAALRMRKKVHFVYEIKKKCLLNSGSVTFRKLTTSTCENY